MTLPFQPITLTDEARLRPYFSLAPSRPALDAVKGKGKWISPNYGASNILQRMVLGFLHIIAGSKRNLPVYRENGNVVYLEGENALTVRTWQE